MQVLGLVLLLVQLCCSSAGPNVILFVIDDIGWSDAGYQGAEYSTPTIDKLASEGVRLKQHYVQPLCSPTRAALLSGRYPYHLGLAHKVLKAHCSYGLNVSEVTLAQQMKKAGYATHAVGKWHVGYASWEHTPTYRGFDSFYGFYTAAEDYYKHTLQGLVDLHDNEKPVMDKKGIYSTNLFTEKIQEIINDHKADDSPFFIYAAYQSIHMPMQAPAHYQRMCRSSRGMRKTRCMMMQALDEGIQNVTLTLEERGYLTDTILILTTDNGGPLNDYYKSSNYPLRGGKHSLWEGGIRGLSFVWGRNLQVKNYDNTRLMHITDWYRTITEGIAGLTLSEEEVAHLDGFNAWDAINANAPSPRTEILLQLDPPSDVIQFGGEAAIRDGDWKLITTCAHCSKENPQFCGHSHPISPVQLFNITEDPSECNNVAEAHPDVVARLRERIEVYNSTHVAQMYCSEDLNRRPEGGHVFQPWLE